MRNRAGCAAGPVIRSFVPCRHRTVRTLADEASNEERRKAMESLGHAEPDVRPRRSWVVRLTFSMSSA